jgi:hypothetical protein
MKLKISGSSMNRELPDIRFYGYQNGTHNIRGCTNPGCLVTMEPKFCVVAQHLWAPSVEVSSCHPAST